MEAKTLGAIAGGVLAAAVVVYMTSSGAPAAVQPVDKFAATYCHSYEEQKSSACREHWNTPAIVVDAGTP